ncbi:hypothetical protein [Massilia endophytica]|uniref:hypothetical protein n=1 Tax=Massilia endophytica TaxID=2899220 RepID=UPI001E2D2D9A|nr:hypothetical protein [Massilia endophytica]UGQ47445.1 hypothetical protein LSQ66_02905 [Massilia endophytica]
MLPRLALVLIILFNVASTAKADATQPSAVDFVQRHDLGSNMETLGLAVAQRTQTFALMASKLGQSEAKVLVSREMDIQAARFQPQWNANLAKVYSRHFSPEELASLASEGRSSRYLAKLGSKQAEIGAEVQQVSAPILTEYVSASLNEAFAKFSRK